jgi:hypothetical protein
MSSMDYSTGTVIVSAFYDYWADKRGEGRKPGHVDIAILAVDAVERDAILALFPKSARLHATSLSRMGTDENGGSRTLGYISSTIKLATDGVNGGRNETGIKRLHSILRAAEKAGLVVEYSAAAGNAYDSLSDLLAAIDDKPAEAVAVAELDEHVCSGDRCCGVVSDTGWQRDGQPVDVVAVLAATSDRATVERLHGADVAELVAERYPSALPLLAGGWTVDAALAHVDGVCDRELCTGEHDEPVVERGDVIGALRAQGWNDEQIAAAIAAAARVAAVDDPPAHRVGCGCMSCDAARVESATAAELDAYEQAERY